MRRSRLPLFLGAALAGALALSGCTSGDTGQKPEASASDTVSVSTLGKTVEVPVKPTQVVALDNTSFETLYEWGVTPIALPKGLLPSEGFEKWLDDDSIVDLGTHREPDLEALSGLSPDLIISGYRFGDYTADIEAMGIAPVIDIAGSDDAAGGWVESLKEQTEVLGEIFAEQKQATALIEELQSAEDAAKAATNGESVFLSVVSGGKIDNGAERIGRIIEPMNLVDVFAGEAGDIHGDSGLAPETIAQANPDWAIVLDRDAAAGEEGAAPAKAVFDAQEAFAKTTFASKNQIVYLDPFFYTREGIQAYTETYQQIADAFAAAK